MSSFRQGITRNSADFDGFRLPVEGPLSAEDLPAELEIANRILAEADLLLRGEPIDDSAFEGSTVWVASQLGSMAEAENAEGNPHRAVAIAALGVRAAQACGDPNRILSNWLTFANVNASLGRLETAETSYRHLLSLPFEVGHLERASAHLTLSSFAAKHGRYTEAVHHHETGVRVLETYFHGAARRRLTQAHASAYTGARDVIGLMYVATQLDALDIRSMLAKLLASASREQAIIAWTRFRRLGEHELATFTMDTWRSIQQ